MAGETEATREKQSHPQTPSQKWAAYQAGVKKAALRDATERAARDREQLDRTNYHRNAETPEKG